MKRIIGYLILAGLIAVVLWYFLVYRRQAIAQSPTETEIEPEGESLTLDSSGGTNNVAPQAPPQPPVQPPPPTFALPHDWDRVARSPTGFAGGLSVRTGAGLSRAIERGRAVNYGAVGGGRGRNLPVGGSKSGGPRRFVPRG